MRLVAWESLLGDRGNCVVDCASRVDNRNSQQLAQGGVVCELVQWLLGARSVNYDA